MARNEQLYQALMQYAIAAVASANQPGNIPYRTGWETWGKDEDGSFRKASRKWVWMGPPEEAAASLPEYATAVEALSSDPVVAPQVDKLVGSPMSAMRFDLRQTLSNLVHASLAAPPVFGFDGDRFRAFYSELESFLYGNQVEYVALMPLAGFHSDAMEPIRFGHHVVLDRMTDDEIASCLSHGALRSIEDAIWPANLPQPSCVRVSFTLPKAVGTGEEFQNPSFPLKARRTQEKAYAACEEVLAALRLFKPGRVAALAYVVTSKGLFGHTGSNVSLLSPGFHYIVTYPVSQEEATDLQAFATQLCSQRVRHNKPLQNALRRFSRAGEGRLPDDVLLDLMIAAESLFLPGLSDELSFRLALNAALLLGDTAQARRSVYDLMRTAYQLRSDVVHGGTARTERLSDPSVQTKTLPEFCASVEETLRRALKLAVAKAASQPTGRALFDWTSMALGTESELPEGGQ